MSSPWAKIQPIEPTNLQDIMSEQVAIDLQAKEDKKYAESIQPYSNLSVENAEMCAEDVEIPPESVCDSDAVIARMLQKQFDKEYDEILKRTEDKFNGASKVSISYSNYRRSDCHDHEEEEDEDELIDVMDRKDWDRFDTVERTISLIPRCGYVKQDGNMLTKHDMTLCGRKNACKLMCFPPDFQTGDGAGFDLQLSNKVFNSLKAHSSKEQARRHKLHDRKEDHATAELGVDEFTRLLLYKLINNQILERVNGVISTGKEAVILHADGDSSSGGFSGSEGRNSFSEGEDSTSEGFTALSPKNVSPSSGEISSNFVDIGPEGFSASRGISSSVGVESSGKEGSLSCFEPSGGIDEKVKFSDGFGSSSDSSSAVGCFKSSEGVAASSGGVGHSEGISSRKEDSDPGKDIGPFEGNSSKGLLSSEGISPLSKDVILPSEGTSPSSGAVNIHFECTSPSKGISPSSDRIHSSKSFSTSNGNNSLLKDNSTLGDLSLSSSDVNFPFEDGSPLSKDKCPSEGFNPPAKGNNSSESLKKGVRPSEDISSSSSDAILPSKSTSRPEGTSPSSEDTSLGDLNTPSKGNGSCKKLNESIKSGSTTTSSPPSKGFRPSLGTSPPSNPNAPPSSASKTGSLNFPTIVPKECVVKIFKTTLSEFKQRDKYIKDDYRFKDRYGKQNSRKMVQLWAEKEMRNLIRLRKIGLPCPEVIALKKHILVMSFIGNNHKPAPKLKDAHLKPSEWIVAYEEVVEAMKKLYSEAKLIHADLSEYNILWHENKCWFIDVSQSVEPTHPNAFHFLFRDCNNICRFFSKRGVPEVKEPRDLFMDITGYDYNNRTSVQQWEKIKPKPHLVDRPEMQNPSQFDYDWEHSKLDGASGNKIVGQSGKMRLVDTPVA